MEEDRMTAFADGELSPEEICREEFIHKGAVDNALKKLESDEAYEDLAQLMKMFSDRSRVKLLHALEQGELCVCDLAALLGVTKSAVSHQLKALKLTNLVKSRRDAQTVYYSLADDHVKSIIDLGFEHLREDR